MPRLLVRSGKDPFTPVGAETTLVQDVFNSNSGNYLFQHSVWRALAVDGTELVSSSTLSERRSPEPGDAARIDEEFDHLVVPMANAFRAPFLRHLEALTELVEQLTIPVTVVGIGSQAAHGQGPESLGDIAEPVKRFVSAVLERSASIGVRGDFTRRHLAMLGFGDDVVDVIGCPSLFLWGPDHRVERRAPSIADDAPLALSFTPEVPGIGAFVTRQAERHPGLVAVGQDAHDLRLLLWGTPHPDVDDPAAPVHLHHPLYQQDRLRLYLDTWTWYRDLAQQHLVYGTRFHGNVAGLLAGTPAVLLAHDSRTLELAEYHRMPHRLVPHFDDETAGVSADELHASADLDAFHAELPQGFARYTAFLERNGLTHRWSPGATAEDFDQRLAAVDLPPAVHTLAAPDLSEVASRLRWLREGMVLDITRHPQRYEPPFPHPAWRGAGSRHARLLEEGRRRDAATADAVKALSARVADLENTLWRRVVRRLRRMVGRG
jgi:hypothetical protein